MHVNIKKSALVLVLTAILFPPDTMGQETIIREISPDETSLYAGTVHVFKTSTPKIVLREIKTENTCPHLQPETVHEPEGPAKNLVIREIKEQPSFALTSQTEPWGKVYCRGLSMTVTGSILLGLGALTELTVLYCFLSFKCGCNITSMEGSDTAGHSKRQLYFLIPAMTGIMTAVTGTALLVAGIGTLKQLSKKERKKQLSAPLVSFISSVNPDAIQTTLTWHF